MEQLPISIFACDNLTLQFGKIISVCNKLEAQFNFQTMAANWYGDEDNILFVRLCIETPQSFEALKKTQAQHEIQSHSDDVFSYYDFSQDEKIEQNQTLIYHIAITNIEVAMLNKQNKLLTGLLHVKLQKVLNLIAKQLKLTPI